MTTSKKLLFTMPNSLQNSLPNSLPISLKSLGTTCRKTQNFGQSIFSYCAFYFSLVLVASSSALAQSKATNLTTKPIYQIVLTGRFGVMLGAVLGMTGLAAFLLYGGGSNKHERSEFGLLIGVICLLLSLFIFVYRFYTWHHYIGR